MSIKSRLYIAISSIRLHLALILNQTSVETILEKGSDVSVANLVLHAASSRRAIMRLPSFLAVVAILGPIVLGSALLPVAGTASREISTGEMPRSLSRSSTKSNSTRTAESMHLMSTNRNIVNPTHLTHMPQSASHRTPTSSKQRTVTHLTHVSRSTSPRNSIPSQPGRTTNSTRVTQGTSYRSLTSHRPGTTAHATHISQSAVHLNSTSQFPQSTRRHSSTILRPNSSRNFTSSLPKSSRQSITASSVPKTNGQPSLTEHTRTTRLGSTSSIVASPSNGQAESHAFVATTFSGLVTFTSTATITATTNGVFIPLIIGPGGVGWAAVGAAVGGGGALAGGATTENPPDSPEDEPGGPSSQATSSPSGSVTTSKSQSTLSKATSTRNSSSSSSSPSSTNSGTKACAPISTVIDLGPTESSLPDGSRRHRRQTDPRELEKRVPTPVSSINDCILTSPVTFPPYSTYARAMGLNRTRNQNRGGNGRIFDAIAKWYTEILSPDALEFNFAQSATPPGNNVAMSIDHVWEKSTIVDFLRDQLGEDFNCADLNHLFFPPCRDNVLQQIFNLIPSFNPQNPQPGFAALAKSLNGMKGWMTSNKFSTPLFQQFYNTNEKQVTALQRSAIIFNLYNTNEDFQEMHDTTNNRIYQAFLGLDDWIASNRITRVAGGVLPQFGPAYRAWYTTFLGDMGTNTWAWASSVVTQLRSNDSECIQTAVTNIEANPLYNLAAYNINQEHLTWDETDHRQFTKRFGKRANACSASAQNATQTVAPTKTHTTTESQTKASEPATAMTEISSTSTAPTRTNSFSSLLPFSTEFLPHESFPPGVFPAESLPTDIRIPDALPAGIRPPGDYSVVHFPLSFWPRGHQPTSQPTITE